jgi:hypothetical protein
MTDRRSFLAGLLACLPGAQLVKVALFRPRWPCWQCGQLSADPAVRAGLACWGDCFDRGLAPHNWRKVVDGYGVGYQAGPEWEVRTFHASNSILFRKGSP